MWPFSKKAGLDTRIRETREWHDKYISDELSSPLYRDASEEVKKQYVADKEKVFRYWVNAQKGILQLPFSFRCGVGQ